MPIDIASASMQVQWDSPESDRRQQVDLEVRATDLLQQARSLVDVAPWRTDPDTEPFYELGALLEGAVTAILDRMQRECHSLSPQQCVDAASLAMALQRLHQEMERWRERQRLRAVTQVQDILGRKDLNLAAALQTAASEACRVLGFDRAMIFRRSGNLLLAEATHFVGQDDWARDCHRHAEENPIQLSRHQTEQEMMRRRAAALVTDPLHDPNTWQPIVQKIRTPGYVATPITVRGEVVATLHADNEISGRRIGYGERDALAAFGTGLGFAIERAVLVDRLMNQREAMARMVAATETTVEDFLRGGSSLRSPAVGEPPAATGPSWTTAPDLTRREREVLELMATGATNTDIAARLVVSPGTVKTHVKHVLRKMNATTRSQAVSMFLQQRGAIAFNPGPRG